MLLELAQWLAKDVRLFNVFNYITLRAVLACLTALAVSLILGPYVIRKLTAYKIGQAVRDDGPRSHLTKAGTPTMGGALILVSIVHHHAALGRPVEPLRVGGAARHARLRHHRLDRRLPQGRAPQPEGLVAEGEVLLAVADRPGRRAATSATSRRRMPALNQLIVPFFKHVAYPLGHDRLRRAHLLRHRRHLERGQPHRRPRRPRHHADGDGRQRARHLRLRRRPRRVLQVPRAAVHPGRGRARGDLRRARRRGPRLPLVQRLPGRGLHGRRRRARARRRARHHRGDRAPGDRAVHHGRRVRRRDAVGDDPGAVLQVRPAASASSAWRRCTTTTSSRAGRKARWWCASGSSP